MSLIAYVLLPLSAPLRPPAAPRDLALTNRSTASLAPATHFLLQPFLFFVSPVMQQNTTGRQPAFMSNIAVACGQPFVCLRWIEDSSHV
jgi:hypothetical protein